MKFTIYNTSLPVNFYTSLPEEVVAPDLIENIGGLADLQKKGTDQWICVAHMVYLVTQVTYRLH